MQSSYIEEISSWLLRFYMTVATYSCYEKVCRTMRTAIVSYLHMSWHHHFSIAVSLPSLVKSAPGKDWKKWVTLESEKCRKRRNSINLTEMNFSKLTRKFPSKAWWLSQMNNTFLSFLIYSIKLTNCFLSHRFLFG